MEELSSEQRKKELSPEKSEEVNEVLSAFVQLPPPVVLPKFPEQHYGDDVPKHALEKIAVVVEENKQFQQAGEASQSQNKIPGQEFDASQNDLEMRELFKKFKKSKMGQELDTELIKKACVTKSSLFFRDVPEHGQRWENMDKYGQIWTNMDEYGRQLTERDEYGKERTNMDNWVAHLDRVGYPIKTFSGIVIHLGTEKMNLQKEKKELNPPSHRRSKIESEIKIIDRKLDVLKAVAKSFTKPEMGWDGSDGEGFYIGCLLVASVDKACHRDMTKEVLGDMKNRAIRGEYRYGKEELGPFVQTEIRLMRLQMSSLPKDCPTGSQHSHQKEAEEEEEEAKEELANYWNAETFCTLIS